VCLSLREQIAGITRPNLIKFFCVLLDDVAFFNRLYGAISLLLHATTSLQLREQAMLESGASV